MGLRRSVHEERDAVITSAAERYQASFDGFVSGGTISTLMDCHGNWTVLYTLMEEGEHQRASEHCHRAIFNQLSQADSRQKRIAR